MASAIPELAARAALWWLDHKPFSKEAKARRKAKREARKNARRGATEVERKGMAIETGFRTSTNLAATGGVSLAALQLLQEIEWPWMWLTELMDTAAFAQIFTFVVVYVTARLTKSPKQQTAI